MAKTRDALSVQQGQSRKGLQVRRLFTTDDAHPYDELTWERRDAVITNWRDGSTAFEQRDLEFPAAWSQNATNIVAQKYFRGPLGTPQREHSVRQMVDRVAGTITNWGVKDGYFAGQADAEAFRSELTHLLVNQRAAFNSPVWFNVGVEPHPQCSACQPYDALISTPTGMVPIGELVERQAVGTVVYDAHGETRVRAVKFNGSKRVYRVRLRNGSFIEATGDHVVFATSKRRSGGAWLRIDQLQPGMRLHLYPHRASNDDVVGRLAHALDSSELQREAHGGVATLTRTATETREAAEAALAGWLQADGFVGQYGTGTNTSLTIEFMTVNEDEYDWVQRQLQVVFPDVYQHVRTFETADQGMVGRRIRLDGEVLRPFVEAWGLMARQHDLRVPGRLWTASNEVVAAYLRSVFQADGYVTVQGGSSRVAVGVVSEAWTEDLQVLLLRLGIYSRRLRRGEARANRSDLHEIQINMRSERVAFSERPGRPTGLRHPDRQWRVPVEQRAGAQLLHPVGRGHDALHPQLVRGGRADLQGRLGSGHQPVDHPFLEGAARQRGGGLGPRLVHAWCRRLGGHHQERRQDPQGRQDGGPERRPPRRPRLHLVQGP